MDSEREKLRIRIIEGMSLLTSMYGLVSRNVQGESKKEEQHIFDCYKQVHHESFKDHLGKELFNDLIKYNRLYNNKEVIRFTE